MVTDDVGSSRRVREQDPETWRISEHHVNPLRPFIGQSRLLDHSELDECELGENLQILNHPELRHELMHVVLITKLRDPSKPDLPHQDPVVFFPDNLLGLV